MATKRKTARPPASAKKKKSAPVKRKASPKAKAKAPAKKKRSTPARKKAVPKADEPGEEKTPLETARDAAVAAYRDGESLPTSVLDAMAQSDAKAQRASLLADIAAALGVNDRQRRFAELVVEGTTGTEAYIQAGFSVSNRQTAESCSSRLLSNAKVAAFVKVLRLDASRSGIIGREQVLEFLSQVLRTPLGEVRADSNLCQKMAIDEKRVAIEMPSKLGAVAELAKILGWYKEQTLEAPTMTDADLRALVFNSTAFREELKRWIEEAEGR